MREHLGFLRMSSVVVKIAAWIFLCLGLLGAVSLVRGNAAGGTWLMTAFYVFFFFFLYLIAKIADLLTKIINEIKKE